jgi:S-adenosylmethionine:tRNA ribosyltransferase-isomerase
MHGERFEIPAATAAAVNHARSEGRRVVALGTTSTRALERAADQQGEVHAGNAVTELFIRPGFRFRVPDALITIFHLPKSTLLVLVAAFAGRELIFEAYQQAVRERYRFFSYGDCMLII